MSKALPSYMYGDPAEAVDRKRGEDQARSKRRAARMSRHSVEDEFTEEELRYVPADWLKRQGR